MRVTRGYQIQGISPKNQGSGFWETEEKRRFVEITLQEVEVFSYSIYFLSKSHSMASFLFKGCIWQFGSVWTDFSGLC